MRPSPIWEMSTRRDDPGRRARSGRSDGPAMITAAIPPRGRTSGACLLFGPLLLATLTPPAASQTPAGTAPAGTPNNRIRLFRIQPGFQSDPLGLEADEPPPAEADGG